MLHYQPINLLWVYFQQVDVSGMPELSVMVRYKTLPMSGAATLCVCWAIFWVVAALFCWEAIHTLPLVAAVGLWALAGAAFVYVPFAVVSFAREGGMLIVNDEGIALPPAFCGLGPRPNLHWRELKRIECADGAMPKLILTGNRGAQLNIKTKELPQEQIEQVIFALEVLGHNAIWSQQAGEFRDQVQNKRLGVESSFTALWDDELKRRYAVTTFAPHPPGTTLQSGRYTVKKQLAFGGFAAVYLCEDENRQQLVLKELVMQNETGDNQAKALELFERESSILAKLEHPKIARVRDHFVENNRHYMCLEYIEGENLRQFVKRKGPTSEDVAMALARQMCEILGYLHGLTPAVVHRDFTPDNLIVSKFNELTLVDFGAANDFVSSATGTLVGKQSYMPIEQIRGHAETRSDLYAMGGVLYFLLTATDPEPLSVCQVKSCSPQLRKVIERLTQIEPEERYKNADEVLQALSGLGAAS